MSPGHHDPHGSNYNNDLWLGHGGYTQHSHHGSQTQNDYTGFEYTPTAPIPLEPNYMMNRPPPYAPPQHGQMPPPLIMPQQHMWPSMLANASSYPQPILPAVSVQTPLSATSMGSDMTPTSAKTSTSRRKLTDDERRLMCLEAENNPTMKQTQIGAKFNVERSTVSKILRQKEKYMKPLPKEEENSPGKKPKAKQPDVEKTLINWARNHQKRGLPITTDELRKQVQMFTSGRDDQSTYASTEWLEAFQRHHISGSSGSPSREATVETSTSHSETLDSSPISEDGLISPPMSALDEFGHRKLGLSEEAFDFKIEYDNSPLISHGFSSERDASSELLMSPLSPEMSRDYVSVQYDTSSAEISYSRQRSMTLPHLAGGDSSRPGSASRRVPALPARSTTMVSDHRSASIDPRQTMKRHKSVPDIHEAEVVQYSTMRPPPVPRSADISPVGVPLSPVYPDDTLKALNHIKRLLEQRPDVAEPDDYVMIGKLMEKLKLLKTRSPTGTPALPGRMHHLNMGDSPRLNKKRTVLEISN